MTQPAQRASLVTGATGFVGSYLVRALAAKHGPASVLALVQPHRQGRELAALRAFQQEGIRTLECDLLELPGAQIPPPEFDTLYHLAAFADTEASDEHFRVNSDGTRSLLRWLAPRARGKRVVYAGTLGSVDRDCPSGPATEETPCSPKTVYGRTKLEGEESVRAQAAELGFDFTILRLCTVIGQGYRPNGMFGRCPKLLAENKLAARLNWPGRVSFIAARDLARILTAIPETPATAGQLYVVSNGEDPTFDQLLGQMALILGLPRHRINLPPWFWRVAGAAAWPMACSPWLPRPWRIFCWRVSHIIHDGIRADASKLNKVFGSRYQSVLDALRETYGQP